MGKVLGIGIFAVCFLLGAFFGEFRLGVIYGVFLGGVVWLYMIQESQFASTNSIVGADNHPVSERHIASKLDDQITQDMLDAADSGKLEASLLVGCAYLSGSNGLSQDIAKASRYLLSAAQQDHPFAAFVMAGLYRHGLGVQKDFHEAYSWGLAYKRVRNSSEDEKLVGSMLTSLELKNREIFLRLIEGSNAAQRSFPRRDGEVAISHKKMAKQLWPHTFSVWRGRINQSDSRPYVVGHGYLPVAYVEYTQNTAGHVEENRMSAYGIQGFLENMKPGAILIIPAWQGVERQTDEDESYDLSDEGWIPHRRW